MTTKEKILEAALDQFNSHGFHKITIRHIASAMQISHGNLAYHFPNKAKILEELHKQLVDTIETEIRRTASGELSLTACFEMYLKIFEHLFKYRGITTDLPGLMRLSPATRDYYEKVAIGRKAIGHQLYRGFVQMGLLDASLLEGDRLELLILQQYIIGEFWLAHASILFPHDRQDDLINHYLRVFAALMLPYFTEKGKAQVVGFGF